MIIDNDVYVREAIVMPIGMKASDPNVSLYSLTVKGSMRNNEIKYVVARFLKLMDSNGCLSDGEGRYSDIYYYDSFEEALTVARKFVNTLEFNGSTWKH